MVNLKYLKQDLERMKTKRNNICIELGNGYDWMLCDSLIAIDAKIKQAEKNVEDIEKKEEEVYKRTFNSIKHQKIISYDENKIFSMNGNFKVYGKDEFNNWYLITLLKRDIDYLIEDAELLCNPVLNVNGEPIQSEISLIEFSK